MVVVSYIERSKKEGISFYLLIFELYRYFDSFMIGLNHVFVII